MQSHPAATAGSTILHGEESGKLALEDPQLMSVAVPDLAPSLAFALAWQAGTTPGRTAYIFLADGETEQDRLTYGALDARARAIAAALSRSCQPGERALLLDPPGLDFICAFFGCLYAGVIAVPAYPPRSPRRMPRLMAILADAQPAVALAAASSRQRVRGWLERTPEAAALPWLATDEVDPAPAGWEPAAVDGDAVAFLQYTSGSTSAPKGVMVTHGNLLHNQILIRDACGHSERSVFVSWLPPYHDLGLIGNLLQAAFVGGSCVLMSPEAFLQRPARWLEAVSRYGATTSGGPNFAWDLCVRKVSPGERRQLDLSRWEIAFNGAEPVRAETLAAFAAAFAESGFRPGAFYPCYGLAEATLMVSGGRPGDEPVVRDVASNGINRVSCGAVLGGQELAIVDPATEERRGPGEVGEIWLSGPSVAAGYWNRPEETAEAFGARLPDGTGPFLRTGDLGLLADGELFIAGRLKDLIILRGRNHYPQDIERTAELAHPALQPGSTAAFAIEVDGEERLAVVVERRPRSKDDIESVAPAVRQAVAEEHEVQVHAVVLVPPGGVLKTSSGKVRRRACRELFLSGQMETLGARLAEADWIGEAPRGDDLLAILRLEAGRILQVDPARLPAGQPLTALGLDSLGAIELEQRIAEGLGIELPASGLLEGASLDDLVERAELALPRFSPLSLGRGAGGEGLWAGAEAPLSAMQTALWFEQQLAPASPAYNIAFALRLRAEVDAAALRRALEILVDRHAALRATILVRDGQPAQRFAADATLAFTEKQVSELAAEAHRPFDLDRGPLFRAVLLTGPADDRVLLLAAHHIVFDGWSLWVLLDELRRLLAGAALPALPAEYADFVRWQEEMLAGPEGERLWQFWRAELPEGMPPLQLPADRPAAGPGWQGAIHRFPLAPELAGLLRDLARQEGTTLYAVLLAGYQALLSRWTGQPEIVVGAAVSGRSRPEFRGLVGCLFNTVPLRADLGGDPTFRGLLRQVRSRLAAAHAHQDYPSHLLAERLQPGFQTHFLYQKPHLDLGDLIADALLLDQEAARSPLELEVFEAGEAVSAWFRYSTARFEAATVERLARQLTTLLTEAIQGPERPVSELPLLEAAEQALLLEWSSTGLEYPEPPTIHQLFAEQVVRTPDKVAAVCGAENVTYRELAARAGNLAQWLRNRGLEGGNLVELMARPDHALLTGMLGILEAGKAFVPLDPDAPAERLERMIADCGFAEAAGGMGEGIAYVIFTSGSTGAPKGVPITHQNLVPLLLWSREVFGFGETTRALQSLSPTFDFGVFEILSTLLFGGTLVLRGGAERSDVEGYLREVRRHGVNTIHTTPSFFRAVAAAARESGESLDLEILHLGGEALSEGLVADAFAVAGERCRLFNGYGPTEASVNCALFEVGRAEGWRPRGLASVPIGRPSAANRLYVLDRRMQPVPVGSPGELFVGGPALSRGYLGRSDLTAARFLPDPFGEPGGRLYRTGDLVRFHDDGVLEFLGRVDHQVKIRGYRIELEEIEAALAALEGVRQAAVVAQDQRLIAYVAGEATAEELRGALRKRLPGYMVPAAFVFLPALPLNVSGKVDRRALPPPTDAPADSWVPPRTPLEVALAGIWSQCLGVERIGLHDDFFALGGHSLLLTQVISHIRKELGVEVPIRAFFEAPVLADLVAAVERAGRADLPPIRPVPRDGELPLSFAQERLWFLAQLDPGSLAYHVPRVVRITGDYKPPAMEAAYEALVARHEIFRTVLRMVDGRPVQHILPPRPFRILEVDLSGLPATLRTNELERWIASEVRRPFDLVHGPMLRAILVRLGPSEYTQIQTEHHLVHDGWTQGVMLDDLLALYTGFAENRRVTLRPLPIQYADFAVWQREWLTGEVLERELSYWKEQLAGMPPVLELPADRPRPPVQSHRGSTLWFELPESVLSGLHELSRRTGVTPFMTFFGSYATLLHRFADSLDLVVGTAIANRTHAETEGLIGFFVNTLLLRTDFSGEPSFAELLGRLRSVTLGAYAHQQLPFEKLVEELDPERDLSHTPLCQVMFLLQNAPLPPLELPGVRLEYREVENGTAKFDLTMSLQERDGILGGWMEYSTDLFDRTTIERLRDRFARLLDRVIAEPERRLIDLPLLSDAEQHALIADWNDAAPARPGGPLLHEWLEISERAGRIAARLREVGVGPEVRVGVLLEPGPDLPAALLGVLAAGGAYVPLDPSHPAERLAWILKDSGMAALVTRSSLEGLLPPHAVPLVRLDTEELPEPVGRVPLVDPDNLAYVIYTSGSTGKPKGVEVPHGALVNFLRSMQERPGLSSGDVLLATTTVAFDIAALEIFLPLVTGARVVLAGRDVAADGRRLAAELAACGATVMQATPATWSLLFEAGWPGAKDLRVLCGGEALPRPLADRLLATCREVWNLYGPTETTVWSGVSRLNRLRQGPGPVTVDEPVAGTELYVLDRAFRPAPIGVPGELAIGGGGLARGYHGRPALTAERFVPDPLSRRPGARLYRTGDLARRLADGRIDVLGRLDHQIKLRGFRIELGEVEASLAAHPAVAECAAVLRDDPKAGPQIVGYVVPASRGEEAREAESVAGWSAVWDDTYRETSGDPAFDISGWTSSVTGEPLGPEQMGEWVEATVERILELQPERVLEIGCGTGLLLHRIAPRVRSYCATDVSPRVVERLQRQVEDHVSVIEARADELEGFAPGSFDVVILNSVVQYFPSVDYLLKVLDRLVPLVAPGGSLFLGDIRSLPLLEAFHLEVEMERAPAGLPLEELRRRVSGAVAAERELVLDPRFFHALARRYPAIAGVGLQVKRGRYHNELTRYRYDAVLRLAGGTQGDATSNHAETIDWQEAGLTLARLRARLAEQNGRTIAVRRIPNARLRRGAVDPQDLWDLGEELGWTVAVTWSSGSGAEGLLDAVFSPNGGGLPPPVPLPAEPWSRYANSPRAAGPDQRLAPQLAAYLRDRLPSYMVPAAFVVLDALPLNPSGKVDRKALPRPDADRADHAAFVAPRTELERTLTDAWCEVLGLEGIGIHDSFFALGGHSLLGTRLVARLESRLGVELPLRTLFEAPTVAAFAGRIEQALDGETGEAVHRPAPSIAAGPAPRGAAALVRPGAPLAARPDRRAVRRVQHPLRHPYQRRAGPGGPGVGHPGGGPPPRGATDPVRSRLFQRAAAGDRAGIAWFVAGLRHGGSLRRRGAPPRRRGGRPPVRPRPPAAAAGLSAAARRGRPPPGPDPPSHRGRRLVAGRAGARAGGSLPGGGVAGAADPVRRLRPLAAELARRRDAGPRGLLVAGAARRSAGGDPSAHRPPAGGNAIPPRGALPRPPAAAGGAGVPRPRAGRDPLHGPPRRFRGPPRAVERRGGSGGGLARRQPQPGGDRRADRLLRQHAPPAHRPRGRAHLHRPPGAGAGGSSRGLCPSGHPLREAGRGPEPLAAPRPHAALPGLLRAAERPVRGRGGSRPLLEPDASGHGDRQVRPDARAGAAGGGARRGAGAQPGPLRSGDRGAAPGVLAQRAGGHRRQSGDPARGTAAALPRGASAGGRRLERDPVSLSPRGDDPRAVRGAGGGDAGGSGDSGRGGDVDLPRAEPPGQPPGAPPPLPGRGAGGSGGSLPGALPGADRGDPGHPQGRRRLRPARSVVSAGAAALPAGRQRGAPAGLPRGSGPRQCSE